MALAWLLLGVFAINFAGGLFPFTLVEGDEQGVLNGVRELARAHPDPRWLYLYPLQAGSYQTIRALVLLGLPSPDIAFGLATVLGGIGCIVGAALLIARLLNLPWVATALWICAIPEMSSACFYLNTSSIAGPFAWAALVVSCGLATWTRALAAGLLLGFGGWVRIDALSLAPGVLLLWWRFDQARAIRATAIAAMTSLLVLVALWTISGISLHEVAEIWRNREATRSFSEAMRITFLAFGPGMLLIVVVGCGWLIWQHDWWSLLFGAVTTAPTLLAHGHFLTTPKYLYFCLPVWALLGLRAVWSGPGANAPAARYVAITAVGLLGLDWFSAVRTWAPERQRFKLDAPMASITQAHLGGTIARWVIGYGELIWTDDGYRARGGYWFAPKRWHEDKANMIALRSQLAEFTRQPAPFGLVTCGWVSRQAVVATLLEAGFRADEAQLDHPGDLSDYTQNWRAADGRICRQVAIGVFGESLLPRMLPSLAGRECVLVSDQTWRPKDDTTFHWAPFPKRQDGLVVAWRGTPRISTAPATSP